MCGRYAITLPPEAVRAFFGYAEQPNFPPRYNIAPTQPIPIVRRERDGTDPTNRHFRLVRWGFVPGFVKGFNAFRPIVNARCEGLADKPSFRNAFRRRRCLVIADGFYEWQRHGSASQPFLIRRKDRLPFGLAGLWENWIGADGSEVETACIITAEASGAFAGIHARTPVIIDQSAFDLWLDPDERTASDALRLMTSADDAPFDLVPIGSGVNKVANDEAAIQDPVATGGAPAVPRARPSSEMDGAQGSLF